MDLVQKYEGSRVRVGNTYLPVDIHLHSTNVLGDLLEEYGVTNE